MMPLEKQDDADLPNIRVRKRYVNDALTIPDDAPDAPQQIVRPWPSDKPLPKVEKIFHIYPDHAHHLAQVVRLETRVKYDKGLVDATGSHLDVGLKINSSSSSPKSNYHVDNDFDHHITPIVIIKSI